MFRWARSAPPVGAQRARRRVGETGNDLMTVYLSGAIIDQRAAEPSETEGLGPYAFGTHFTLMGTLRAMPGHSR
jgi:hypothetical protein